MRFLNAASLSSFKCYDQTGRIELDDVNIFAGPNNAGKSALILALRRLVTVNLQRHPPLAHPAGRAFLGPSTEVKLADGDLRETAEHSDFSLELGPDLTLDGPAPTPPVVCARFYGSRGTSLWCGAQQAPQEPDKVDDAAHSIVCAIERLPVVVVPEHRALSPVLTLDPPRPADVREELVVPDSLLAEIVNWACERSDKLSALEDVAGRLLGNSVRITASSRDRMIYVQVGGDSRRAITYLGAGIAEVLTIALAAVKYRRALLLYEEPEMHLHPYVQRQIISALVEMAQRQWQIILTTHSNHVLDFSTTEGVTAFAVSRSGGKSRLRSLVRREDRGALHDLLNTLGVRPSSGLQPQTLIWVEGPSDAAYLRFFIGCHARSLGSDLEEFVDYAFAFFGGALLAHQSALVAPVESLVDLVGIHRNSVVVLDSDRVGPDQGLGKAYGKEFVEKRSLGDRVWVTDGREMENYLRDEILIWAAIGQMDYPSAVEKIRELGIERKYDIFADQVRRLAAGMGRVRASHDASDAAKARFAAAAVEAMSSRPTVAWLDAGDLHERVAALVTFIRRARGDEVDTPEHGAG